MKMKSSPEALLEEFYQGNTIKDYEIVKKIILCVMCCFGAAV